MNQKFWKRCVESATAFLDKFQHDVLFKTQVVFFTILVLIVTIDLLALGVLSQKLVPTAFDSDLEKLLREQPTPSLTETVLGNEPLYTPEQIFVIAAGISTFLILSLGFIATRMLLSPIHSAVHMQRNFISQISHELRMPLSVARTNVEVALLQKERLSKAELAQELKQAVSQIDKVAGIIDNLTTLSTVSRLRLDEYRQHRLNEIISETIEQYSDFIKRKDITMQMECEPDLFVWSNRSALVQMVSNITANAVNFTPSSGAVTISAHRISDTFVRLSIADTGIGIPSEDIKFVFKPFYRSQNGRAASSDGSGLGLSIVRELVRLHAGRIGIESIENEGTTVTVDLPVKPKRIPFQPKLISNGRIAGVDFDYKTN